MQNSRFYYMSVLLVWIQFSRLSHTIIYTILFEQFCPFIFVFGVIARRTDPLTVRKQTYTATSPRGKRLILKAITMLMHGGKCRKSVNGNVHLKDYHNK
jgi:hypothetical protein